VQHDAAVDRIRPLVQRVTSSYGLEVFDVQFRREPAGWMLRVIIDRPTRTDASGAIVVEGVEDSIGLDECRHVSEDLSALLDVEDVVEPHYTLEVSSPGLDRPLRHADDYRRFAGRLAKIVVREAVDGQMHFEGRLMGVDGGDVLVTVGRNKEKRIPLARIARARLDVEF
jgi:ribosome maturation factor RimP